MRVVICAYHVHVACKVKKNNAKLELNLIYLDCRVALGYLATYNQTTNQHLAIGTSMSDILRSSITTLVEDGSSAIHSRLGVVFGFVIGTVNTTA